MGDHNAKTKEPGVGKPPRSRIGRPIGSKNKTPKKKLAKKKGK